MLDRVSHGFEIAAAGHASPVPIRFEGVGFATPTVPILEDVDLEFGAGGPTVVVGPNGSGKTTLLKLAMGLLLPTSGRITFGGAAIARPGSRAIVLQKPVMLRRTAADNIAFALKSVGQRADAEAVERLLQLARIGHLAERPARRLSGGEQQRLALVRALARSPQVLFLDEPTASLDPTATKLIEDLIREIATGGVKIVMSTHDLGQARRLASDVVLLAGRRVVEAGRADRFFTAPVTTEAASFLAGALIC